MADDKETPTKADKPAARPVNNQALAAMLRECAGIVEKGTFDPILYTALQDFRTYYKANYPTKKKEKSSTKKKSPRKSKSNVSKSNEPPTSPESPSKRKAKLEEVNF